MICDLAVKIFLHIWLENPKCHALFLVKNRPCFTMGVRFGLRAHETWNLDYATTPVSFLKCRWYCGSSINCIQEIAIRHIDLQDHVPSVHQRFEILFLFAFLNHCKLCGTGMVVSCSETQVSKSLYIIDDQLNSLTC